VFSSWAACSPAPPPASPQAKNLFSRSRFGRTGQPLPPRGTRRDRLGRQPDAKDAGRIGGRAPQNIDPALESRADQTFLASPKRLDLGVQLVELLPLLVHRHRPGLSEAARRLGERLNELRALEKARAQRAEHERVQAERDRLAAEMERMGEPIAEIARLVAEIDACDREIRNLNATTGLALGYIRPALAGWVKA
jgi:hypothetical protein